MTPASLLPVKKVGRIPWACWRCRDVVDAHLDNCPRCGATPERNRADIIDNFCYLAARRWGDFWAIILVGLTGLMGFGYFESVISRGTIRTEDVFQAIWWSVLPGLLGIFLFRLRHWFTVMILLAHAMICLYLTIIGICAISAGLTDHTVAVTSTAALQMSFPFVFGPIGAWMAWMSEKLQVTVL